jgi:hypothetical protein
VDLFLSAQGACWHAGNVRDADEQCVLLMCPSAHAGCHVHNNFLELLVPHGRPMQQ